MRVALIAFGTRGDVTPFIALGSRLQSAGHSVCLATHSEFESLARKHRLDFRRVPGSFQDLIATREGREALGVPRCTPLGLAGLFHPFRDCAEAAYRESWEATQDVDGVVTSAVALPATSLIAARRGIPLALGQVVPAVPTRRMPHPAFRARRLGGLYNRATYMAGDLFVRRGASRVFARWLREANRLSTGPPRPVRGVVLVAVSRHVVPRPPDWPAQVHLTGYWFAPQSQEVVIPSEVEDFLESGPRPICLGFGSMMDNDPVELRRIVAEALERLQVRAVVVAGSGNALLGFGPGPQVREVQFLDYGWLFSRVSAVVHQGGAGTSSYCLSAGVPQVIVRYCLDHEFWAWRMRDLAVAPPSLLRRTLSAAGLASAIRRVLEDDSFRRKAEALAPLIREEDGLDRAVSVLTGHFSH